MCGEYALIASDIGDSINDVRFDGEPLIYMTSEHGNVDAVRALLDGNAKVDEATGDGRTALTIASEHGHVDVVRALLEGNEL